jgi:hypothetical protein
MERALLQAKGVSAPTAYMSAFLFVRSSQYGVPARLVWAGFQGMAQLRHKAGAAKLCKLFLEGGSERTDKARRQADDPAVRGLYFAD